MSDGLGGDEERGTLKMQFREIAGINAPPHPSCAALDAASCTRCVWAVGLFEVE